MIIRFSETTNLTSESGGLLPSMALKAFVKRRASVNIVAMPFFTSTDSWNFMENNFKTRVDGFTEDSTEYATIRKKLVEGARSPYVNGFGHWGDRYDTAVLVDGDVSIPYELQFKPYHTFSSEKEYNEDGTQNMWYDQLRDEIKSGDMLLDVMAWTAPASLGGEFVKIADIKLLSDLYTSVWGD